MKQLNNFFTLCLFTLLTLAITSCSGDNDLEHRPTKEILLKQAKEFLNGDIVLSTKATMNGVDKTLLPQGCPTMFRFTWKGDDIVIELLDFSVGKMPITITFKCRSQIMQLNSWEKDEYKGEGWIKIDGKDGVVAAAGVKKEDNTKGSGASVKGYYNVKTHQIIFIVDYNMMNVRSKCFLQTIDKNRINNYEAEFKKYEEDLEKYKKEHGLD